MPKTFDDILNGTGEEFEEGVNGLLDEGDSFRARKPNLRFTDEDADDINLTDEELDDIY